MCVCGCVFFFYILYALSVSFDLANPADTCPRDATNYWTVDPFQICFVQGEVPLSDLQFAELSRTPRKTWTATARSCKRSHRRPDRSRPRIAS